MKRYFFAMCTLFVGMFSFLAADDDAAADDNGTCDTLQIVNMTHRDETGPGRHLHIVWEGDIANAPQYTKRLAPGEQDSCDSTDIGDGNNVTDFALTVYRLRDDDRLQIGDKFHYGILNISDARTDTITIFKNCTENDVELYYEYINQNGVLNHVFIGHVPVELW